MNTQKENQVTKPKTHLNQQPHPRPLSQPLGEGGVGFFPSDAEKGNPAGEGGVDLSAARRGIEQTAPFAPQVEPFINKPEVARRLNKTLRTVDDWMKRGILPHYKISRSVSFKWSEIERQLADTCRVVRRSRS